MEMRSKGKYEKYRKLNVAFQKKARQDREHIIINKCKQIEDNNEMGKIRNLLKEIKWMTGSRSSSCGAMKLSTEEWFQKKMIYKRDGNNIQKICTEEILI